MNDLMTRSFLSYVDLKKQAMKDLEAGPDIELGKLNAADEKSLTQFFELVAMVKAEMEEITNLLIDLKDLNDETKLAHSAKVLRGLRDRINADMVTVIRKANLIKTKLVSLDSSNANKCGVSTPVYRTRITVTSGLRAKLRDMMNEFQALRNKIIEEHKEGLKKRYFSATGEEPSEAVLESMILGGGQDGFFEGKGEFSMETKERRDALDEIQRSLIELHKVFLDMAVLVDTQGEQIDDIEQNVANAGAYVSGGTKELDRAKRMRISKWARWIGLLVLVLLMVCLISILLW